MRDNALIVRPGDLPVWLVESHSLPSPASKPVLRIQQLPFAVGTDLNHAIRLVLRQFTDDLSVVLKDAKRLTAVHAPPIEQVVGCAVRHPRGWAGFAGEVLVRDARAVSFLQPVMFVNFVHVLIKHGSVFLDTIAELPARLDAQVSRLLRLGDFPSENADYPHQMFLVAGDSKSKPK